MSRPPHSAAYPLGGTEVPPFPQMLRNSTVQNTTNPSAVDRPPPTRHERSDSSTFSGVPQGPRLSQGSLTGALYSYSPEEDRDDSDLENGDDDADEDHLPAGPANGSGKSKRKSIASAKAVAAASDGPQSEAGKVRRRRQVQSCSECRRRKIKCDKKFPCGPCVLRNDQSICKEVEKHSPTVTGCASMQEILHLQQRIAALETLLTQAGVLDPTALEEMLGSKGRLTLIAPNAGASEAAKPGIIKQTSEAVKAEDAEGESDMEGAALTLEHYAFGRRKTEQSASNAIGASMARPEAVRTSDMTSSLVLPFNTDAQGDSIMSASIGESGHQMPPGIGGMDQSPYVYPPRMPYASTKHSGVAADLVPSKPLNLTARQGPVNAAILDALEPTEVFSIFYQRSDVFVRALLSVLPDRIKGELLVRRYLERVEWLHRCLHVPTFLRQCEHFWNMPLSHVVTDVYTPFLSLYLIVLCLGLTFMDPQEAAEHFTPEEQEALPEVWITASRGMLWMGDFMAVHTIEHLQTMILHGVFLNNRDRADAAWALTGAAIKMAQGMGLSRLGGEAEPKPGKEPPTWKAPWESLIKREVGRRLWWNLVFLDWSLAPSYNFASTIHPDQIKTALPANVNDEDIIEGVPLKPRPLSERTSMSYHLARIRFAEISQRQIWQANASPHPPYSFILSVDTELRKAIAELPSYFAIDVDKPEPPPTDITSRIYHWEKIIINLSGQSRLMRLHRPWLSRGYKDAKYEYSRLQCIRAARNCLRIMSDNYGTAVFLEKWWIPLFYVTVAAVVVMIDLLRTPAADLEKEENKEKYNEVTNALDQIRQVSHISHPARGSTKVIEQLLSELDEKRMPASLLGKRKAEGEPEAAGGLQRAVKKLILEQHIMSPATKGTNTPNSSAAHIPSPSSSNSGALPVTTYTGNGNNLNYNSNSFTQSSPSSTADQPYFPMGISTATAAGTLLNTNTDMAQTNTTANFPQTGDMDFESMLAMYMPSSQTAQQAQEDLLNRMLFYNLANSGMQAASNGGGAATQQTSTGSSGTGLTPGAGVGGMSFEGFPTLDSGLITPGGTNPYRGWMG